MGFCRLNVTQFMHTRVRRDLVWGGVRLTGEVERLVISIDI